MNTARLLPPKERCMLALAMKECAAAGSIVAVPVGAGGGWAIQAWEA
jgi:hypothetical protein